MTWQVVTTKQFDKDVDTLKKSGHDLSLLKSVIALLLNEGALPPQFKDHPLKGDLKDFRECRIAFDWILIYRKEKQRLVLVLQRTGTHSKLLKR